MSPGRALFACVAAPIAVAAGVGLVACEPTPGTPIPPDTGVVYDDDAFPPSDAARDTTPADIGIYDAPELPDGNCQLFGPSDDAAPQAIECTPGTTCDVSGLVPLCATDEDGGVLCGQIYCIGPGGCGGHALDQCVGFYDNGPGN